MTAYRAPTKAIAAEYDVPYSISTRSSRSRRGLPRPSHLRPEGRVVWQAELAHQLAALYDDGTLRTEL